MTTPDNGDSPPEVDLTKSDPAGDVPFDPYRFGKPDRPIPPEYAPPGYIPPAPEVSPTSPYGPSSPYGPGPGAYGPPPAGYGQPPYGAPGQQPYGAPPPGPGQYPGGYGAPPPPGYPGYAQQRTGNGKAVAALVLGIVSIVFCWLSVLDAVPIVLALVFGLIAMGESKSRPGGGGRGMAISGLVCCLIGAVLATIVTVKYVHAINECGGLNSNRSSTVLQQCIRDNL